MLEKDLEIKSTNKQRRKLVDYFNQWWEEKFWEKWHFKYTMRFDHAHIISKKFWFIEWLVREDKIVWRGSDLWYEMAVINGWWEDIDIIRTFDDYEQLLMILAIQDDPIDFLISTLRQDG